jgi:hypothetical protein
MYIYRFIVTILMTCAVLSAAQAQIKIIPRDMLEARANPKLSADSAWLDFDRRLIVAEPMNEDDAPKTFRYRMTNSGKDTLHLKRLNSTCSCAMAVPESRDVAPGESTDIIVTYDPKGHPGRFERKIFVYTMDGNSPAAILRLQVHVNDSEDFSTLYRHQMGNIRLRRPEVSFKEGEKGVEKIPFVNLTGKPLKLQCDTAMLPGCLSFSVVPSVVEDRGEGEIVISFDPSKTYRPVMTIILKDLGVSPSRASIKVNVNKE